MKKKLLITAGIGMVVLLVSGALIGVALAADPTPTPTPNGKAGVQQTFISKLAKFLGITDQQLTDAVKKAQNEMVDDGVKAGKLNQDQADRAKQRIEKGGTFGPPMMRPFERRGGMWGRTPMWGGMPMLGVFGKEAQGVADFLGMKPADLTQELRDGKTLAQIAQEHGKTRDQLKANMLDSLQKNLDDAVSNGKLTKERADQIKQQAGNQIDKLLDASRPLPPKGTPNGTPNNT